MAKKVNKLAKAYNDEKKVIDKIIKKVSKNKIVKVDKRSKAYRDEQKASKNLTMNLTAIKTDSNKRKLLDTLLITRGLVLTACRMANLNRSQHYKWCHDDPNYKAEVDAINALMVEGVENKLGDLIDDNNTAAIIFYLKTKGRDSGYGNQIKVDANVTGEITVLPIKIVNPNK